MRLTHQNTLGIETTTKMRTSRGAAPNGIARMSGGASVGAEHDASGWCHQTELGRWLLKNDRHAVSIARATDVQNIAVTTVKREITRDTCTTAGLPAHCSSCGTRSSSLGRQLMVRENVYNHSCSEFRLKRVERICRGEPSVGNCGAANGQSGTRA